MGRRTRASQLRAFFDSRSSKTIVKGGVVKLINLFAALGGVMAFTSKLARGFCFSLAIAVFVFTMAAVASALEQPTQEAETLLAQLTVPDRPAETHAGNPESQVPWPDGSPAIKDSMINEAAISKLMGATILLFTSKPRMRI